MKIVLAIIIFSILILIHEFGHFLIAKKNGVRVIEFSLGFGPRLLSFTKGETRYSWKLLPFGGSCIMQGEEQEDLEGEDKEKSFNSKSVWARMSIILAGPIFNFLLALVLAFIVTGFVGYDPARVISVEEGTPAYEAGLKEGDIITKYNNNTIFFGRELMVEEYIHPISTKSVEITYERDGKKNTVSLKPADYVWYVVGMQYTIAKSDAVIGTVTAGGPLEAAGVKAGDIVVNINGTQINSSQDMYDYFKANELSASPVNMTLTRDGKELSVTVTPIKNKTKVLGFTYNTAREKTTALGVIKNSFLELEYEIEVVFKSLGMLFTGKISTNDISGPVGIVDIIGQTYDSTINDGWFTTTMSMSMLIIMLSANLGVINLLPFPAIDGGRIVFLIIEAVRGKPISKEKEGIVHFIGMILLMILMVLVLYNDIRKL